MKIGRMGEWTNGRLGACATVLFASVALAAAPGDPAVVQEQTPYNGKYVFARLRYQGNDGLSGFRRGRGGNGPGWRHDYPTAEHNLMNIIKFISVLEPGSEAGNIIDVGDPELHKYPVAYMSEPGYWTMNEQEVENLRNYLLKGGFLIFDDFPRWAWENFYGQMQLVLPELRPVVLDASHPIFHSFFEIESLNNLYGSYLSSTPTFLGYFEDNDPQKQMLAIVNFENDLGENWEAETTGFSVIPEAANESFKFGINYIMYALSH